MVSQDVPVPISPCRPLPSSVASKLASQGLRDPKSPRYPLVVFGFAHPSIVNVPDKDPLDGMVITEDPLKLAAPSINPLAAIAPLIAPFLLLPVESVADSVVPFARCQTPT